MVTRNGNKKLNSSTTKLQYSWTGFWWRWQNTKCVCRAQTKSSYRVVSSMCTFPKHGPVSPTPVSSVFYVVVVYGNSAAEWLILLLGKQHLKHSSSKYGSIAASEVFMMDSSVIKLPAWWADCSDALVLDVVANFCLNNVAFSFDIQIVYFVYLNAWKIYAFPIFHRFSGVLSSFTPLTATSTYSMVWGRHSLLVVI